MLPSDLLEGMLASGGARVTLDSGEPREAPRGWII